MGSGYAREERDEILQERAAYQLKAHGNIDTGHQRFTYPNPRDFFAFDPATGKDANDQSKGRVTFRLDRETIKHLQKFAWNSPEWQVAYGQRNQVEMSNMLLKNPRGENLGDGKVRTAGSSHTTS